MESLISTIATVSPEQKTAFKVLSHDVTVLLHFNQHNNNSYVFEMISPAGASIPLHVCTKEDEVLYILEGEFELTLGDKTLIANPGDCFNIPKNTPHGYTNIGLTNAKTLWFLTPGNNFEDVFEKFGAFTSAGERTTEELNHFLQPYGINIPA